MNAMNAMNGMNGMNDMKRSRSAPLLLAALLHLSAVPMAAQDGGATSDGTGGGLPLETTRTVSFTTDEGTWLDLDVSPDGATIVFDLLGDLYALPVDGGRASRLTEGQPYDAQPRFSPDGSRIVFVSDRSGGENVWVMDADGSDLQRITRGENDRYQSPEWTPDGRIVVSKGRSPSSPAPFPARRYDRRSYDLVLYDPRGGTGVEIPLEGEPNAMGAAFGPDPRYLYAAAETGGGGFGGVDGWSVVVFDRETGTTTTRARRPGSALRPVVSPDGRWLVYGTRWEDGQALRLQDLETGDERFLLTGVQRDEQESLFSRDLLPGSAFLPDGSALVMYHRGKIQRVDVPSGETTVIPFTADVELPAGPLARFDYRVEDETVRIRQIRGARPSPDGRRLVFTAMNRLWIMDLPDGTPRRLTPGGDAGTADGAGDGGGAGDADEIVEATPAWSPDGRWIAYVTWTDGPGAGGDIRRVRVPEAGAAPAAAPERLTRTPAFWEDPAWSPDGSRIAAVRGSRQARVEGGFGTRDVVWIPADGGPATTITSERGVPHFTADTSRVWLDAGDELVSLRWDGLDRRTALTAPGGQSLRISPGGGHALAMAGPGPQAYVVTLPGVGGVEVRLASPEGAAVPVQKVTEVGAAFPGWYADGERFHYSLGRSFFTGDVAAPGDGADGAAPVDGADGPASRVDVELTVPADRPSGTVALRGARLVTMRADEVIEEGDLVVRGNRIVAVGAAGTVEIPADAREIDASGTTILPGYVDAHGHVGAFASGQVMRTQEWPFLIMLAYGVTTVRDPSTGTDVFGYVDLLDAGRMVGPRLWATGPVLTGAQNITSLDDARDVVTRYGDFFGTRYIKQYGTGERQVRQWLIMAAAEKEITAVTEPYYDVKKDVTDALDGYPEMGHGWPIFPIYDDLVQVMARTGMAHTATLTTTFGGPKGRIWFFTNRDFHDDPRLRRFMPHGEIDRAALRQPGWYADDQFIFEEHGEGLRKMLDAGVDVAIGAHGDFDGIGYHWEMEMHAMGGIAPEEILRSATLVGARVLGLEEDLGSLEPGKLADLQVLERNPLDGIEHSRSIRWVMKNGRLYEADTLTEIWPRERALTPLWWW